VVKSLRNFDRLIARELLNLFQQYFCRPFKRIYLSHDRRINVLQSRRAAIANYYPLQHTKFIIRDSSPLFITVASYYSHFAKRTLFFFAVFLIDRYFALNSWLKAGEKAHGDNL